MLQLKVIIANFSNILTFMGLVCMQQQNKKGMLFFAFRPVLSAASQDLSADYWYDVRIGIIVKWHHKA